METFAIFMGGDLTPSTRLLKKLAGARAIAADSGMRHAATVNITPELWVGDFDSSNDVLQARYDDVERLSFVSDKDMTDGEIAIEQALLRGAEKLILIGAFGGERMDHEFCHLTQALRLAHKGIEVQILDGEKEAYPLALNQDMQFDFETQTVFSILAFSDLERLTIKGAKWSLENADIPFGSSLTLSNEVAGTLKASLNKGLALLHANLKH